MLKKIFILLIILAMVFASCRSAPLPEPQAVEEAPPVQCAEVYVPLPPKEPPSFEPNEFEHRVFELTNRERAIHRLPPLIWHDGAAFAAREHSIDMNNNDFMRHTGSDGSDIRQRLERACIKNTGSLSASIAGGWLTPEEAVQAWMDSPIYRPNILRREFTHTGVGFFERPAESNSRFATYWTQKFFVLD
jgi:uncharacterized protein YkwD